MLGVVAIIANVNRVKMAELYVDALLLLHCRKDEKDNKKKLLSVQTELMHKQV